MLKCPWTNYCIFGLSAVFLQCLAPPLVWISLPISFNWSDHQKHLWDIHMLLWYWLAVEVYWNLHVF